MLDGEGRVTLWQTTYFQMLPRAETGHPVRHLVHNGPLRCLLAGLSPAVATGLLAAYDAALAEFYPLQPDGRVFYPSGRLFLILHRGGR